MLARIMTIAGLLALASTCLQAESLDIENIDVGDSTVTWRWIPTQVDTNPPSDTGLY